MVNVWTNFRIWKINDYNIISTYGYLIRYSYVDIIQTIINYKGVFKMSAIVLNPKSISKLANNYIIINGATYNKYQENIDEILQEAYALNIQSYNLRYPSDIITDEQKETFYKVDFKSKEKYNNICEVLKVFQKLRYNIDDEYFVEYKDTIIIKFVDNIIDCIKNKIISELEDYNNINYGDI